jgi:hypothetical protein
VPFQNTNNVYGTLKPCSFKTQTTICVAVTTGVVGQKFIEEQLQILRLTTPKLKNVWGPVRSG